MDMFHFNPGKAAKFATAFISTTAVDLTNAIVASEATHAMTRRVHPKI